MQIEPQKLDQNLLEKSHGSLFTEENREKGISMKGLPRVQLTKKKRRRDRDWRYWFIENLLNLDNGLDDEDTTIKSLS